MLRRVQVAKSELSSGEDVEVSLRGTGFLTMEPFMGFLLQVQPNNMSKHQSFVAGPESWHGQRGWNFPDQGGFGSKISSMQRRPGQPHPPRLFKCTTTIRLKFLHQGSDEKTSVTALWRPGSDLTGQVRSRCKKDISSAVLQNLSSTAPTVALFTAKQTN